MNSTLTPVQIGYFRQVRINAIGSISTYTPVLGASSRAGHPMLPAGAGHGIMIGSKSLHWLSSPSPQKTFQHLAIPGSGGSL